MTPDLAAFVAALEAEPGRAVDFDAADTARLARLASTRWLTESAQWYAANGIAVFPVHGAVGTPPACTCGRPCPSPAKHPRTTAGFKDATTDLQQVRDWWRRWPDANIGAPTGLRFDVIDIDGRRGIDSVLARHDGEGLEAGGLFPPVIARAITPRGGGHHLYVAPTGEGNRAGLLPGVDHRGVGGYVLLPPSHGVTGRQYAWLRHLDPTTLPEVAA